MFDDLLSRLPADPPRSLDALPGLRVRAQLSPGLLIPLGFILIFSLFPLAVFFSEPHLRLQLGETATVEGTVVARDDCGAQADSGGIRYAFVPPGGVEYHGTAGDCRNAARTALRPGDKVAVKYLVEDPSINDLAERSSGNGPPPLAFFLLFPMFPASFILPILLPPVREAYRSRRIARHGLLAKGTVVYAKSEIRSFWPGSRETSPAKIFIAYRRSNGQTVEARAKCPNTWLLNQLAPGSSVTIAYLPNQPESAVLLDAYIR